VARALEARVRGDAGRVGILVTRHVALALGAALLVRPLAAQLPAADQAFQRGDYAAARASYERVLASDSTSQRALYRLAILDSWDGKLVRSLARFVRLRRIDPRDPDIMVTHAQVLAWAGRTAASEALYDSVLARYPDRADALAGRARVTAWGGDLDRAEGLWRTALERHPDDPELLVGLAQTLYWKGQPDLAAVYATRARAVAPEDRTVRDLARAVRAALRPEIATKVDGASDSDDNAFVAQEATISTSLGSDLRGTVHAGWRYATLSDAAGNVITSGTSYGGGAYGLPRWGRAPCCARAWARDASRPTADGLAHR
jgi:tetratricopeptide (TPR) repeat protein